MNRLSFIKSFLTICAAPSLLRSIEVKTGLPKTKIKKGIWFKVSKELSEDKEMLEYLIKDKCKQAKIDYNKPFAFKIGHFENDFIENLLTCVITQYE